MAFVGLANIKVAKCTSTGFTGAVKLGEAIGLDIEPQFKEGALYGDNRQVDQRKKFKNAKVSMETTTIPSAAQPVLFGHAYSLEDKTETSNIADEANYVGVGAYTTEVIDGAEGFVGIFMPKVKFSEGKESYQTENDTITYVTPSIEGVALGDSKGDWRTKKVFDTAEAAEAWIDEMLSKE